MAAAARKAGAVLAVLALVIGAGALAILLLSGPGSRLGWWSFRTGLGFLFYAAYGGLAAIVLGLLGLTLGGRRAMAAIAVVAGIAAVVPPYLFRRTAQSVPPIHDITTDTDDPPAFVAVWVRPADALERHTAGTFFMIFPTIRTLERLAQFKAAFGELDKLDAEFMRYVQRLR